MLFQGRKKASRSGPENVGCYVEQSSTSGINEERTLASSGISYVFYEKFLSCHFFIMDVNEERGGLPHIPH